MIVVASSHISGPAAGYSGLDNIDVVRNQQFGNMSLPANSHLLYLLLRETRGFGVNISLGTAPGGKDVIDSWPVPASLGICVRDFRRGWFPDEQPLFLSSDSWGASSVNASLIFVRGL
jgi:hypothetical protein